MKHSENNNFKGVIEIKIIKANGTPSEIGLKHGNNAKNEVHYSIDSYEKLFYNNAGINWKQAIELAKKYIDVIETSNLDLLEEMEGIAKGASVEFEDILALNARSEIALTNNVNDGCTSLAIMPPLSDKAYLAQNWDWRSAQSRSLIMLDMHQNNGTTIQMVTEGGIIGKIGLNNHGLGVCLNALRANVKSNQLPVHLGLREVLNAESIDEAEQKVIGGKLGSSANFLIAQSNNEIMKAINLELSPRKYDKKETDNAYLYHTNHFCSKIVTKDIGKENLNTIDNTYSRFDRIDKLISNKADEKELISESIIKEWLSDHKNDPSSICRHLNELESPYEDTITAFSIIMNLTDKKMYLMEGQPCQPLEEYHFKIT